MFVSNFLSLLPLFSVCAVRICVCLNACASVCLSTSILFGTWFEFWEHKHVMWALMGKIHFLNGHFLLTLVIRRLSSHYDSFQIHLTEWWQHFRWIEIKFHVSSISTRKFSSSLFAIPIWSQYPIEMSTKNSSDNFQKKRLSILLLKISSCFRLFWMLLIYYYAKLRRIQNKY